MSETFIMMMFGSKTLDRFNQKHFSYHSVYHDGPKNRSNNKAYDFKQSMCKKILKSYQTIKRKQLFMSTIYLMIIYGLITSHCSNTISYYFDQSRA